MRNKKLKRKQLIVGIEVKFRSISITNLIRKHRKTFLTINYLTVFFLDVRAIEYIYLNSIKIFSHKKFFYGIFFN